MLRLLRGDQGGAVSAQGDTITLNLGPIIEEVSNQMVDAGFSLAGNIPTVDREFTLVQSEAVTKAQTGYRLLDTLGTWLPFVSLGLIAAGVLLARDRWRALVRGALGVTMAMVLLGVALAIARTAYVNTTPADILTPEAAGDVFDTLVRFLRTALRAVAVLGLVVAAAAFLSGHSPQAVRARGGLERGIARLRRRGEQATGREHRPVRQLALRPPAAVARRRGRPRGPGAPAVVVPHRVGGAVDRPGRRGRARHPATAVRGARTRGPSARRTRAGTPPSVLGAAPPVDLDGPHHDPGDDAHQGQPGHHLDAW